MRVIDCSISFVRRPLTYAGESSLGQGSLFYFSKAVVSHLAVLRRERSESKERIAGRTPSQFWFLVVEAVKELNIANSTRIDRVLRNAKRVKKDLHDSLATEEALGSCARARQRKESFN